VNDLSSPTSIALSIAAVERDTGLSKDTLRVWERRYGFPTPRRDESGERAYPLEQVDKLRAIKRLLDAGHRPGRVVPLTLAQLQEISDQTVDRPRATPPAALEGEDIHELIGKVRSHDVAALRDSLNRLLARHGVARFVLEVLSPLTQAVGDAWIRGQLEIFEEHLYSENVQVVLRGAIAAIPPPLATDAPRVLLSTFPGEPHGLGLLMAEALLALEGCRCVSLGAQTPLWDITLAAAACRSDVVALAFSGCMSPNQTIDGLIELRSKLPEHVALWAGGGAPVLHRRVVPGVLALATLDQLPQALRQLRQQGCPGSRPLPTL
jgi:DNA-binding transcriptional MerR regulator